MRFCYPQPCPAYSKQASRKRLTGHGASSVCGKKCGGSCKAAGAPPLISLAMHAGYDTGACVSSVRPTQRTTNDGVHARAGSISRNEGWLVQRAHSVRQASLENVHNMLQATAPQLKQTNTKHIKHLMDVRKTVCAAELVPLQGDWCQPARHTQNLAGCAAGNAPTTAWNPPCVLPCQHQQQSHRPRTLCNITGHQTM